MARYTAVSYTHLDVYKRQELRKSYSTAEAMSTREEYRTLRTAPEKPVLSCRRGYDNGKNKF